MGVELVPTPKRPNIGRLRSDLLLKFYQLRMLLFGRSARALKTLDMESSLNCALMRTVQSSSSFQMYWQMLSHFLSIFLLFSFCSPSPSSEICSFQLPSCLWTDCIFMVIAYDRLDAQTTTHGLSHLKLGPHRNHNWYGNHSNSSVLQAIANGPKRARASDAETPRDSGFR